MRRGISLLGWMALGCVGEASVTYKGTVTVAKEEPGYTFDEAPNLGALEPIAGATIALCLNCAGPRSHDATSTADGSWGPVEQVFGGGLSDTRVRIFVRAEGFEDFEYRAIYESTTDPSNGEKFLNVRLKPIEK